MASIYRHRSSKWIAVVRRKGLKTQTRSFVRYTDAKRWAASTEMTQPSLQSQNTRHTLHAAIDRYATEYIVNLKSVKTAKWELSFFKRHIPDLPLNEFYSTEVAQYRDFRLSNGVSGSSINRELNSLSRLFDIALKEWRWTDHNPVKDITRPKNGKHRERRPTEDELNRIQAECKRSGNEAVWAMIQLAIETGMRQAELLGVTEKTVDLHKRTIRLSHTKNGESRVVPLSRKAHDIIRSIAVKTNSTRLFPNWSSGDGFRSTFKRVCKRARVDNLRFHDLRHEAASRFFEMGLNQFQVAVITDHKSLQSLHRYTHINLDCLINVIDQK